MVENQFLERLNLLFQSVMENTLPFGGKQVIFLGDFHQRKLPNIPYIFYSRMSVDQICLTTPELFFFAPQTLPKYQLTPAFCSSAG